jgi:hypothetical protein
MEIQLRYISHRRYREGEREEEGEERFTATGIENRKGLLFPDSFSSRKAVKGLPKADLRVR